MKISKIILKDCFKTEAEQFCGRDNVSIIYDPASGNRTDNHLRIPLMVYKYRYHRKRKNSFFSLKIFFKKKTTFSLLFQRLSAKSR